MGRAGGARRRRVAGPRGALAQRRRGRRAVALVVGREGLEGVVAVAGVLLPRARQQLLLHSGGAMPHFELRFGCSRRNKAAVNGHLLR